MYDNKTAIEEAIEFIDAQPIKRGGYLAIEILTVLAWVSIRISYEREYGVGTQSEQLEWFTFLLHMGRDERIGGARSLARAMLTDWAAQSKNVYATGYHSGHMDGRRTGSIDATKRASLKAEKTAIKAKQIKAARATKGRQLIGANSRAKVATAAVAFRHLSKEKAAVAMAGIVNLDPGTIRRYLSQQFPGDKWKQ